MAVFRDEDIYVYERFDYELLQNGAINLYYSAQVLAEAIEGLKNHQYLIDEFDCSLWGDEEIFHNIIAEKLGFPGYYGKNLDALNDCFRDLEIPEESGRAFVFHRYDLFASKLPKTAWHILDIIEDNSRFRLLFGRRLIALVQSDDPRIIFENLGARSAGWNRKEWLNSSRGL